MLFYIYFTFFLMVGVFVTKTFSDVYDPEDNPVLNRFGTNNICVYFDDPPFNLIASTLWFPSQIMLLSFDLFDFIRVRDHYLETNDQYPITKGFYVYYTITTII